MRRACRSLARAVPISKGGAVKGAEVEGDLAGTTAGRCIEYRVQALEFPASDDGASDLRTSFSYRAKK